MKKFLKIFLWMLAITIIMGTANWLFTLCASPSASVLSPLDSARDARYKAEYEKELKRREEEKKKIAEKLTPVLPGKPSEDLVQYKPDGKVIASWKEYDRETPKRIFLLKKASKTVLLWVYDKRYDDGTRMQIEMDVRIKKIRDGISRIVPTDEFDTGEYYDITKEGFLFMYSGIDGRQFGTGQKEQ